MGQQLSVQFFGSAKALADGEHYAIPDKHLGLLALLADSHPRPVPRTQLARYLWPGADPAAGRHSLSQALYRLRRVFGHDAVETARDHISLGDITCDLWQFQHAIAVGDWSRAASLYKGPFLDGFYLENNVDFAHWLDRARTTYEREAKRILSHPLSPAAAKSLAGAVPGAEVPAAETSPASPFVGRADELRTLHDAWQRCAEGALTVAVVKGPPGIGKTALCDRALKRAVMHGALPFVVEGAAAERNLPFGAIGQLLDQLVDRGLLQWAEEPWRGVLGDIHNRLAAGVVETPQPGPSGELEGDFRLAAAFHHLLGVTASSQPIAILVDDVQWVDDASLSVLHYSCRANMDQAVLFILAVRSGEGTGTFWRNWPTSTIVELEGLSRPETKALVRKFRPELIDSSGDGDTIFDLSQGNPLLVHALLGGDSRGERMLAADAKEYFSHQLSRLTQAAREMGAAIAVVGTSVDARRLSWLTQFSDSEASEAIRELLEAGYVVLDRRAGHFAFKHHLIADVFLESLPPIPRARLHRRAGTLLQDAGSPAAVVATQFAIAGSKREACEAALAAAYGSLALFAYREAEHFFRIAVAHATEPAVEVQARCALADLLLQLGRAKEAAAVTDGIGSTAVRGGSYPEIEAYGIIASVGQPTTRSHLEDAATRASEICPALPLSLAGRLLFRIGRSAYQSGFVDLALDSVKRSLRFLEKAGKGPVESKYEVLALACEALWGGEFKHEDRLSEIIAQSSAHPSTFVSGLLARASINHTQGRAATAESDLMQALETCERYGLLIQQITVLCNLAVAHMEQGEWAKAIEHAESIIDSPIALMTAPHEVANAMANRQIICFESAEFENAIGWGDRVLGEFSDGYVSSQTRINALGVKGLSQLALGRLSGARESESQLWPLLENGTEWSHDVSYVELFLSRMLVVGGNEREAVERLSRQVEVFGQRDVYCAARMEVELLRLSLRDQPRPVIIRATALRNRLLSAGATPLLQALDRVVFKAKAALTSD